MKGILLTLFVSLVGLSVQAGTLDLVLELEGLNSMKGQHYEGWNIIAGKAVTTGRFAIGKSGKIYLVGADGKPVKAIGDKGVATFQVDKSHAKSTLFVLTIEPNNDQDEGPSSVHIMGGNYSDGKASLTIEHGSSLGTDFSSAQGSYILAAPTGGDANQGVWFVDPTIGQGSLSLPTLPTGWAYEGWIVNKLNGKKFSTGVFQSTMGADSDGAGPLAGPLKVSFPMVPGQDIVKSPVVLDDGIHSIVVTVEPYPDFDKSPYALKILKNDISKGAPLMTPTSLENISKTAPKGLVHIH